ncbi:MAG: photosystem II reaction center protein Psb28 [Cyanobacteria bacterium QH_8_48_120]|jgi:photosystem II protein|nr:MAG: photosystem II reaction center protein Psb28 [Cyanobacteria bacterium QH_1_48_107]PSO56736.1 MAG: photosystem II reaction center protein Psb28 [Cyanobacteria bacterium QH_10_48_56]PSO61817.1 MAG: photosystem II reaction center protein Psb28 [Cyanobacteria bacterium QH_6_48_35]PSO62875.1 MAG: photosystem II reaction center protein Psb28 [Cyanobacteria bacterium QH_2_48_84]PSO67222.1 MAG: photosystem II reaction center protein Psb28 [Cyanobacteria bacterium QH_7_48_89]PSO70404.1 MAG: pho
MAHIQFIQGVTEADVPEVKLTRGREGDSGTATFFFENPKVFSVQTPDAAEITGMYLIDEEGEISTQEVKGKFLNGQAQALEAVVTMKSQQEWDRFMRFMERYAQEHGLEFSKS